MKKIMCSILVVLLVFSFSTSAEKLDNKGGYTVYLTFDDGPSRVTAEILDILAQNDVKATFFVIKNEEHYTREYYYRIRDEGHAMGFHTCTHIMNKIYKSVDSFIDEIEEQNEWLEEEFDIYPDVYRFPGGSHSNYSSKKSIKEIQNILSQRMYMWYDWDIDSKDSGREASLPSSIIENVIGQAKKLPNQDLVILFHDDPVRKTLPDALPEIIRYFRDNGYKFDCLDSFTILKTPDMTKSTKQGEIYYNSNYKN